MVRNDSWMGTIIVFVVLVTLATSCMQQTPETVEATRIVEATVSPPTSAAPAGEMTVGEFAKQANIDWRQAEGTVIDIASPSFYAMDYMAKNQVAIFEELTGIQVNWEFGPPAEMWQKNKIDMVSGSGELDVIFGPFQNMTQYMVAGYLEPLDGYLDDPNFTAKEPYEFEDFSPGLIEAARYQGALYGLPATAETNILYYRKDLLEEAGLEVPKTFEELEEAAAALHKPGEINGIALRVTPEMFDYTWNGVFQAFGGKFFADYPDDMTPTINSLEGIAATEWYARVLQNYGPPDVANWGWSEILAAMQQGMLAMTVECHDLTFQLEDPEKSETAGSWGYAIVPSGPSGTWPAIWSAYLGINVDSPNKEAAWLFVEFMTSPQAVYERDSAERESIWELVKSKESLAGFTGDWIPGWMTAFGGSLAQANPDYTPRIPEWAEIRTRLGMAVQSVVASQKDAQAALNEAQTEIEKIEFAAP